MLCLRRMVQESAWSAIMTVLAQARVEANDTASAPPLVMVKREQVTDILGLLEPFGEAMQVKEKVETMLWLLSLFQELWKVKAPYYYSFCHHCVNVL